MNDYRITILTKQLDQKLSLYIKRCESYCDASNTSKWCEMIYRFYKKKKRSLIYRFFAARLLETIKKNVH